MGDATRQAAHGFHLLGLAQMVFGAALRSDVARDSGRAYDLSIRLSNGRNRDGDIQMAAILGNSHRFVVLDPLAARDSFQDFGDLVGTILGSQQRYIFTDDFIGAIAVHGLGAAVPTGDGSVQFLADDGVGGRIDNGREAPLVLADLLAGSAPEFVMGAAQFLLDALAIADVANGAEHERSTFNRDRAQADFNRELRAVATMATKIETCSHPANFGRFRKGCAVLLVMRARSRRNQHFDFLANEFVAGVAEHGFGLGIDLNDGAFDINGYDGIRDRFQKGTGEKNFSNLLRRECRRGSTATRRLSGHAKTLTPMKATVSGDGAGVKVNVVSRETDGPPLKLLPTICGGYDPRLFHTGGSYKAGLYS